MQRYMIPPVTEQYRTKETVLGDDFFHHITRVMRMKAKDKIFLTDNNGVSFLAEITNITADTVVVKWLEDEWQNKELPINVTLACGLPKGDKLDLIVQKGTELGANNFIPFIAKNSIVKWDKTKRAKKIERLQKIAKEAAEQSHRRHLPKIEQVHALTDLLQEIKHYTSTLVAYEESAKEGEAHQLYQTLANLKKEDSLLFIFGPEGGFTPEEITAFLDAGAKVCGLGPRILRTETAPLYALSAVSYQFELQ